MSATTMAMATVTPGSAGSVLLMGDWPIFGEPSLHASRMVLAAEPNAYAGALDVLFRSDAGSPSLGSDTSASPSGKSNLNILRE